METPETEGQETEFIVGREGLKLPSVDYDGEGRRLSEITVLDFFHKLWELNGKDPKTEYPFDGARYKPKPYSHELVLPGTEDSVLTVIRGDYRLRDSKEVEYDTVRDETRQGYDRWGVTYGTEKHSILLPPKELGEFVPFITVTQDHRRGGNGMGSGISVTWQTQGVREKDHEADISQPDVQEYWRQTRENYSRFIGSIIKETVEFLS